MPSSSSVLKWIFFVLELDAGPVRRSAVPCEAKRSHSERPSYSATKVPSCRLWRSCGFRPQSSLSDSSAESADLAARPPRGNPHAVDHGPHRHALLRVVEHDARWRGRREPRPESPAPAPARRLPRQQRAGHRRPLVGAAVGQELHRRAALVRIASLRLDLHARSCSGSWRTSSEGAPASARV